MLLKDLLIPFYCDNCSRLAFLFKAENSGDAPVLEFSDSMWRDHQCFKIKGPEIWKNSSVITTLNWGIEEIPFKGIKLSKTSKETQLSAGVLLSIVESKKYKGFYPTLNLDNQLIFVRSIEPVTCNSAGILIDLTSAKKVGQGKYRIKCFEQVDVKPMLVNSDQSKQTYLGLSISTKDQEQLERFVDKFLEQLSRGNLFSHAIIPIANEMVEGEFLYRRKLLLPTAKNLQKTIENLAIPEAIQIDVQQID